MGESAPHFSPQVTAVHNGFDTVKADNLYHEGVSFLINGAEAIRSFAGTSPRYDQQFPANSRTRADPLKISAIQRPVLWDNIRSTFWIKRECPRSRDKGLSLIGSRYCNE